MFLGERILVKLEVNNTAMKATSAITVTVDQVVEFSAGNIRRRKERLGEPKQHVGFEPCYLGSKLLLFFLLFNFSRCVPYFLPVSAAPSTSAKLVKAFYELTLNFDTPPGNLTRVLP